MYSNAGSVRVADGELSQAPGAHGIDEAPDEDLAGLRSGPRAPFMPSLLRPPGSPRAVTTADVAGLLAELRCADGLGLLDRVREP